MGKSGTAEGTRAGAVRRVTGGGPDAPRVAGVVNAVKDRRSPGSSSSRVLPRPHEAPAVVLVVERTAGDASSGPLRAAGRIVRATRLKARARASCRWSGEDRSRRVVVHVELTWGLRVERVGVVVVLTGRVEGRLRGRVGKRRRGGRGWRVGVVGARHAGMTGGTLGQDVWRGRLRTKGERQRAGRSVGCSGVL